MIPFGLSEAALTAIIATLVSALITGIIVLVGHLLGRKSSKEAARITEDATEATTFKIVTDQLFSLNAKLQEDVMRLEGKVDAMAASIEEKNVKINTLEDELEANNARVDWFEMVSNQMASYIERLIAEWPGNHAPPVPDPPVNWKDHL